MYKENRVMLNQVDERTVNLLFWSTTTTDRGTYVCGVKGVGQANRYHKTVQLSVSG